MIRVCLVEDQALVREGIESLLALTPNIRAVAHAVDGTSAVDVILACQPDVVLLDLILPGLSGIEILHKLKSASRFPPVLVLTTFDDDSLALQAIKAGARGYMLKDVTLKQLTHGIEALAGGGTMMQPAITTKIMRDMRSGKKSAARSSSPLTRRETEILRLVASGFSNREIAAAYNIVEGTAKNHVSNILDKLEVRDRTRAVLKALEWGYL